MPEPFPLLQQPLGDGVVELREWRPGDSAARASWAADEEILRWTGVPPGYTVEQALERLLPMRRAADRGEALSLAIVEEGVVQGAVDVRRPRRGDDALAEVAYLLVAGGRGRGLATRAVRLAVDWSVATLGMRRLEALVHPENVGSQRVLERVGFEREGLLRGYGVRRGERRDMLVYGLLADERASADARVG